MSSIQENLARMREDTEANYHLDSATFSHGDDEVSDHHGRILREYEDAIRDHERKMAQHRRALDGYRPSKRSKHSRAREDDGHDHDADERGAKRRVRLRFKESHRHHSDRERRAERAQAGTRRQTDPFGRDKPKDQRTRSREARTSQETEAHGDGDVDQYISHPLARPKKEAEYLDPSLSPSRAQDPEPEPTRQGRREHRKARDVRSEDGEEDAGPDAAFRSSLFDALADDEGAALYWENVYNQPIHIYTRPSVPRTSQEAGNSGSRETGNGEESSKLDLMTDDEYVEYVKRKMWERKNPHLLREMRLREERAKEAEEAHKRRRSRDQRRMNGEDEDETSRRRRSDRKDFMRDVDEALTRGQKRQEAKRYREAWEVYLRKWDEMKNVNQRDSEAAVIDNDHEKRSKERRIINIIPWPVVSLLLPTNKASTTVISIPDIENFITAPAIEQFLHHCPLLTSTNNNNNNTDNKTNPEQQQQQQQATLLSVLKKERAKFHPDKMMHRFGGEDVVGKDVLRIVTAVFQAVDGLVDKERGRS